MLARLVRWLGITLIVFQVTGCVDMRPNARLLKQVPREAPGLYQQAWREGCVSGMSASGNVAYKIAYQNTIDPVLRRQADYAKGWNEAYKYCMHYTMATLWESGLLNTTPAEETLLPSMPAGILQVMARWGNTDLIEARGIDGNQFSLHRETPLIPSSGIFPVAQEWVRSAQWYH